MLEIIACNELIGKHYWSSQPPFAPHQYLKLTHRHRFTIETRFAVKDEDRELEIFDAEQRIDAWLAAQFDRKDGVACMGETSCETLARTIVEAFAQYGCVSCEVREDGRGGARYARQ